jgi:hypothetical protein
MITGQLAKVRDALASEVAVVIDDRDQIALADQEADNEDTSDPGTGVERVQVAKRVWSTRDSNLIIKSHLVSAGSFTYGRQLSRGRSKGTFLLPSTHQRSV